MFWTGLSAVSTFVFQTLSRLWSLMLSNAVLFVPIGFFVVNRVAALFYYIKRRFF